MPARLTTHDILDCIHRATRIFYTQRRFWVDKRILDSVVDAEQKIMLSRIIDIANAVQKQSCPKYSSFLDPASICLINSKLHFDADLEVRCSGGYGQAERKIVCVYPDWYNAEDDVPVAIIKAQGRMTESLTHRDYLGALMGLGIKRETIGDIIPIDNTCYIFCKTEIAEYIIGNFDKVGRYGVRCTIAELSDITLPRKEESVAQIPVASLRLDAVLSAAMNLSRSKSAEIIASGMVNINYVECRNASHTLTAGDLVSVRKFGRIKIGEVTGVSKKGRMYLEIMRPI